MDNRQPTELPLPMIRLAICLPHQGLWHSEFGMSLAQLCIYCTTTVFEEGRGRSVCVIERRTSIIAQSRQECLEDAIMQNCDYALFLDSDQLFPADTAHRLMKWKKPVVAANIALKVLPSFPTARAKNGTPFGMPIDSHAPKSGLEKVWRVGSGIMLIDLACVRELPKPWFETTYDPKNQQYLGEDWYFCKKMEAAGHDIFIDHELSRQIGHAGTFMYGHANIPNLDQQVERKAA